MSLQEIDGWKMEDEEKGEREVDGRKTEKLDGTRYKYLEADRRGG